MKASMIFKSEEEREQVKYWLNLFDGTVTKVMVGNDIIYENNSFEYIKRQINLLTKRRF